MDIVAEKINIYAPIVELARQHANDIKSALGKKRFAALHRIAALIRRFEEAASSVSDGAVATPAQAFGAVDSASTVEMVVAELYDLVNFDAVDTDSEMSRTFSHNLNASLRRIVAAYNAATVRARANDDRLMSAALAAIETTPVAEAERLYMGHRNSIGLYARYIQRRIDDLRPESPEYAATMTALDRAKTDVMRRVAPPAVYSARLQRFGLVPVLQHLPPAEIYRRVVGAVVHSTEPRQPTGGGGGPAIGGGDLDLMAALFAERGVGVYVLARVTATQIEYDFRPLLDGRVAALYPTPPGCGVNSAAITKFGVIRDIAKGGGHETQDLRLGDLESETWVVVRTINGVDYDVLARGPDSMYVGRATTEGLWRGASVRAANYQGVCSAALARHVRPPREVAAGEVTPLQGVAHQVRQDVMRYVDEKLAAGVPTSLRGLAEFISGDDIETIASRVLIASYTPPETIEMLPTFLRSVDGVLKTFTRKIRESFAMSDLTEFMFVELVEGALVNHIRAKLANIVGGAAATVFDPNQDIYAVLYLKEKILKVEL